MIDKTHPTSRSLAGNRDGIDAWTPRGPAEPAKWISIAPGTQLNPLTASQAARAAGVLVGIGVAEGWNRATEVALCVADAAATGRPLTDVLVLDRIRRNLQALRQERAITGELLRTPDEILSTVAVIALAHLHDGADARATATETVLHIIKPALAVDGATYQWGELVAHTVQLGKVQGMTQPTCTNPTERAIAEAIDAVRAVELAERDWNSRFQAGLDAGGTTRAATGALIGARFGWEAIPDDLAARTAGWPQADAGTLLTLGLEISRLRTRSVEIFHEAHGDGEHSLPVGEWGESTVPARGLDSSIDSEDDASEGGGLWRRSEIVITTVDADTA